MWTDYIDEYCERLAPGLWGEPLNALSNIGFFIAAWLIWRTLAGRQRVGDLRALDILLFLVGLGSLAFHTFATRWSLFLDSGFITIFLLVYLHRFLIRRVGSGPWLAAAGVVGFVALDTFLKRVMAGLPLNGSEFYAAAFFVLLAMAAWLQLRRLPGRGALGAAAGMFVVSIFLRSLDEQLCPVWPLGTHFVWHLLNAAVLYACLRGLDVKSVETAGRRTLAKA